MPIIHRTTFSEFNMNVVLYIYKYIIRSFSLHKLIFQLPDYLIIPRLLYNFSCPIRLVGMLCFLLVELLSQLLLTYIIM